MHPLLFPDALQLSYEDFEIEVVPEGCRAFPHLMESIQEEVLYIATRSRGWDERNLDYMRRHFKLGPLYEANALVLIRKEGTLVGLAGSVNDWRVEQGSLIHLCSLGLLPEAQQRGFLPVMLAIVWILTLRSPQASENFQNRCAFITAITQSPYLYAMLHRLFDLYPSPQHPTIPREIREIARAVVERFDEELELDEEHLILRNECSFFYQKIPYSPNRSLNSFCDQNLRYKEGDVFVLVGRVIPEKVEQYIAFITSVHAELFSRFCSVLEDPGYKAVLSSLDSTQRKSFHA